MNMNHRAPHVRVPALIRGGLTYLDCPDCSGKSIALCFLPPIGLLEYAVLERQVPTFDAQNAAFLGVVSEESFLFGPWQRQLWPEGLTLLSDPLGRLSRQYGVPRRRERPRCHSFVIDGEGFLRYHLVHDLNGQGTNALLEMLKASQNSGTGQLTFSNLQSART